jgi:aryl-alcohol dehydrogenase
METRAAIAREAHGDFTLETIELAGPGAGEVRVRVAGVGLCHTDLIARDQFIPIPLPAVLGHEGAGVVEAIGAGVTKVSVGDRVVLGFSSCGDCPRCEEDLPSYCREFPVLNYAGARGDGSTAVSIGGARVSANFFGQSSFAAHALTSATSYGSRLTMCRWNCSDRWAAAFRPVPAASCVRWPALPVQRSRSSAAARSALPP